MALGGGGSPPFCGINLLIKGTAARCHQDLSPHISWPCQQPSCKMIRSTTYDRLECSPCPLLLLLPHCAHHSRKQSWITGEQKNHPRIPPPPLTSRLFVPSPFSPYPDVIGAAAVTFRLAAVRASCTITSTPPLLAFLLAFDL